MLGFGPCTGLFGESDNDMLEFGPRPLWVWKRGVASDGVS